MKLTLIIVFSLLITFFVITGLVSSETSVSKEAGKSLAKDLIK